MAFSLPGIYSYVKELMLISNFILTAIGKLSIFYYEIKKSARKPFGPWRVFYFSSFIFEFYFLTLPLL